MTDDELRKALLAALPVHQPWCHGEVHAECCGAGDCDCGAADARCGECGRDLTESDEERTSGYCLRCLNGPVPGERMGRGDR